MQGNDYLLEDTERFKQLIKNSFDMIILLNSEGVQYFVSESCEKILGYEPNELIGLPVIEKMLHPDDQAAARDGLLDIIQNNANGGIEYRHRHKNGGWVYLEAFGNNQLDNPIIESIILNVRDISDRKKTEQLIKEKEEHLKKINATKDRLFSIIGHDLRNPFNSIVGFSDLIVEQVENYQYEDIDQYAKIIQDSAQRSMCLLTNLLDWSRAQIGSIEFAPKAIKVEPLLNDAVSLVIDSANSKFVSIRKELPNNLEVFADQQMLSIIFRNLISNAIKFSNCNGEVVIRVLEKADDFEFSISDNGIGIKPEDLDKLFRIECVHTTNGTNNERGTGLGLLLCEEFVHQHNGKIWVESHEGQGATFYFTIKKAGYYN